MQNTAIHTTAKVLGLGALVGTILPPAMFMLQMLPLDTMQAIMLVAAVVWFGAAPFWMKVE
ncbi:MAG: hypothetical protein NTW36_12930 [Planctomycetia bacterium]|jgi:hypothetical protein|nr:hypothetical protein [Planctomycetia bacterium]